MLNFLLNFQKDITSWLRLLRTIAVCLGTSIVLGFIYFLNLIVLYTLLYIVYIWLKLTFFI